MGNTKIIDYLEEKGAITKEKADQLRVDMVKNGVVEEIALAQDGTISNIDIVKAKSTIFNIPYVDITNKNIADSLLSEVRGDALQKFQAIPFERTENSVSIAMVNPFDVQAIQALKLQYPANTKIDVFITTLDGVNLHINRKLGETISSQVSSAVDDAGEKIEEIDEGASAEIDELSLSDAPVTRIVNSILQYAVKVKASDIHIEPVENKLRVRFRVHGVMMEKLTLPKHLASAVVTRCKILANMKIDEKRVPQDGRFQIKSTKYKIDIRVSSLPTIYGEKIVMRLLESTGGVPKIEDSGLRGVAYKIYMDAVKATNGIILITGPTGSGKTFTLAGTLGKINTPDVNVISLENPVEIRVPGVNQVNINPDVGFTFANALRSVLRQDPNKIMVGEIRDAETANLAVEASLTGHLVLSTLHTNSAASAIPRLIEMGIEPYLLAATLKLVVAQRLSRRICPFCRQEYIATDEEVRDLTASLSPVTGFDIYNYATNVCKLSEQRAKQQENDVASANKIIVSKCPEKAPDGKLKLYLYKGKGCDRCGGEGYSGRIGLFEVLKVTDEIIQLMMNSRPAGDIHKIAIKDGMVTMQQDGFLKVIEGITTIEEVLRVTRE